MIAARGFAALVWAALLACALVACSVDRGENKAYKPCTVNADCESNECHKGYCVGLGMDMPEEDAAMPVPDAMVPGMDAAMDARMPDAAPDGGDAEVPMPCSQDGGTMYCYSGPQGTDTKGQCRPGTRTCDGKIYGPCIGQVVPQAEECNDDDDDCDDEIDEDLTMSASCETGLEGACGEGMLICDDGRPSCEQVNTSETEICDGKDNDCNGETDEGDVASVSCYPEDTAGCTLEDGVYTCVGVCKAGVSLCENGMMLACAGVVAPTTEDCARSGGPIAADEDCDGKTDEGCNCDNGTMQDCYSGPEGTLGEGECDDGQQLCTNNKWGPCLGETLPATETCANLGEDNDCDGEDFIPGGRVCVDQDLQGRCALGVEQCVEGELKCVLNEQRPEQCDRTDDDCDDHVDEDFDLQTDAANCGQCGNSCNDGEECCDGHCIAVSTDENNCGSCGMKCGSNLNCCNGGCVNLKDNETYCGACEISCTSGMTCCSGACKSLICIL